MQKQQANDSLYTANQPAEGDPVVITGASGGIGQAIALRLAQPGVPLILVGRNEAALRAIAERCTPTAQIVPTDFAEHDAVERLIGRIRASTDRLGVLVHNAGVILPGEMLEGATLDALDYQYRVNVRTPYHLTQGLLPLLLRAQGQIVFVNSSAGLRACAGNGQYSATKHALKAIADSLRHEVNAQGVRVLSVFPGRTASPLQQKLTEQEGRVYHPERLLQPTDVADAIFSALQLPRTAEITDLHIRPFRPDT